MRFLRKNDMNTWEVPKCIPNIDDINGIFTLSKAKGINFSVVHFIRGSHGGLFKP